MVSDDQGTNALDNYSFSTPNNVTTQFNIDSLVSFPIASLSFYSVEFSRSVEFKINSFKLCHGPQPEINGFIEDQK